MAHIRSNQVLNSSKQLNSAVGFDTIYKTELIGQDDQFLDNVPGHLININFVLLEYVTVLFTIGNSF